MKKKRTLTYAAVLALGLTSTDALADSPPDSSPDASTDVRVTSDWPNTEVIRHLGTSYGTGTVGGRAASITTFHLEKVCRAPCKAPLQTEGSYYVDAPGMHARGFELPVGSRAIDIRVHGASSTPLVLSFWGTALGGATALTGGLLWLLFGSGDGSLDSRRNAQGQFETYQKPADTSAFQAMTLIGGGVMVAGIAGLILFPRTHVETSEGARLDAKAAPPNKVKFTGQGFSF